MIILILNQLNLYFLLLIMCTCTTIDNSLIKKNTHQTAEVKNHFGLKLNLIDSILWISVVVIHYQGCQNHLAIGEKSQPGLFVWFFRKSCKNHPPWSNNKAHTSKLCDHPGLHHPSLALGFVNRRPVAHGLWSVADFMLYS